ncbi:MAG: hypothetical protein HY961_07705 [Ignavibacteriae bacterium]|nr:hypothetical protein [Ignavibacteriota bacterium]
MKLHPLSVQITTKDAAAQREIQQSYVLQTAHPRWELVKIFIRAMFSLKFR